MRLIGGIVVGLGLTAFAAMAPAEEIKTLKELVQRYDATSCKECHPEIYGQWEQSLHAKPLLGPIGRTLATFQG